MDVPQNTEHAIYNFSKGWYWFFIVVKFVVYGFIGIYISKCILYEECLHNDKCNPVVVTYFSILSLACFCACGVPIEKLSNVSVVGK